MDGWEKKLIRPALCRRSGERALGFTDGVREHPRIFNPLHVLGYQISVSDIDSLKFLRLTEHPLIMPHIDGMKSEIINYQALVKSIKPLDQRKDAKGKDTFVLSDWWRCNSGDLPHFA